MEVWKNVNDWEDLYEVSNLGNIRHKPWLKPLGKRGTTLMPGFNKLPQALYDRKDKTKIRDYNVNLSKRFIQIMKNKECRKKRIVITRTIASLVAEHFLETPKNKKVKIHHIDGNIKNNAASNLKYVKHTQVIGIRKDLRMWK